MDSFVHAIAVNSLDSISEQRFWFSEGVVVVVVVVIPQVIEVVLRSKCTGIPHLFH